MAESVPEWYADLVAAVGPGRRDQYRALKAALRYQTADGCHTRSACGRGRLWGRGGRRCLLGLAERVWFIQQRPAASPPATETRTPRGATDATD